MVRYLSKADSCRFSSFSELSFLWSSPRPLPLLQYMGLDRKEGAAQPAPSELSGLAPLPRTIQTSQQLRPLLQHLHSEARMAETDRMLHSGRKECSRSCWVRQIQTPSMVLEEILTSLIMWLFCALIPCLLIGKYELEYKQSLGFKCRLRRWKITSRVWSCNICVEHTMLSIKRFLTLTFVPISQSKSQHSVWKSHS